MEASGEVPCGLMVDIWRDVVEEGALGRNWVDRLVHRFVSFGDLGILHSGSWFFWNDLFGA